MINFCNQFLINFSLGENTDFIGAEDLKSFNLYLAAGNARPTLDMTFTLNDERIIPYLNAGNILKISFGDFTIKKDVLLFQLTDDDADKQFTVGSEVRISACYYNMGYTNKVGYSNFNNSTSLEVLRSMAEDNNFVFVTNTGSTKDRQNWYRESETCWNFMQYVWLHSYFDENTFFSYAMDCDSIYFYDMKKLARGGAKWLVTNLYDSGNTPNVISIPGYKAKNVYGSTSDLVGRNLKISVYNIDTGTLELQDYKLKSFGAIDSNKLNVNATDSLDYSYGIISDDVHENFVKAYNQNVRNNIMYQTFEIYASTNQFKRFKLLDPVIFNVEPWDIRLQGLAFITGIVYQFVPGQFKINLTFSKEAPSGLKGSELSDAS